MINRRLVALLALLGAGCATTSGNAPETTRSGFDGARVVSITPHGNACTTVLCTGLGAQWSSARPDQAIVSVAVFNQITGITGAAVNVDGKVTQLAAIAPTGFNRLGDAQKVSRSDFVVPLQLVRSIAGAKRAWLRVTTPGGSLEDAIVDGSTDSKALHALRRFLAEVDAR
jgi:hypothetical protein